MRPIKFRARTVEGEWFTGSLANLTVESGSVKPGVYISNSVGAPFAYDVIPETVSEFTGLIDRNGKEIYEGDIVAQFNFEDPYFRKIVVFKDGAFGYIYAEQGFIAYGGNYHFDWVDSKSEKIEVIGNMIENPELAKGDARF
jgi:uncharacterized phage protein (TIGR01671 family)